MSDAVVAYYRQFLEDRPWYAEGLSWTVIQPASQAVTIGNIANDPSPPGRFGRRDADLDARLRAAPESVRRAALTLVARTLASRFTFSDPEALLSTVEAIEQGVPVTTEVHARMFRSRTTGDGDGASAVAGLAAAAAPPGQAADEPLGLLSAATYAVPDEWPRLRAAIDALLRG